MGAADDRLYLTDEEIARRLGVDVRQWREIAHVLERGGLPKPDPMFAGRRYWRGVVAFLDRRNGVGGTSPGGAGWEENFNGKRTRIEAA